MSYDFNKVADRRGTASLKYDFGPERKGRDDLLPLWVADMDFSLPQEVLDVIKKRVDHGIFGYTDLKPEYKEVVGNWFRERHGWETEAEWITVTPGVVYAIAAAIRAFTTPQDAVIIQQPVYYPFSECIVDNGRELVNSQLIYEDGRYYMDYEDFERKVTEHRVKLFLLCSPHNPVGRVWTKEELERIGEICRRHDVLVFADEIHCDITCPQVTHTPFAGISQEFADIAIVGTSPSKTFNLAGLQVSNIFIPNRQLRRRFRKAVNATGYSQANTLGLTACKAVYELGEAWYRELLKYLEENRSYVRSYLKEYLPQIRLVESEGTYLLWLDFSDIGLGYTELEKLIVEKAKLWLDPGALFGKETRLFERMNIACPRSILVQALDQLRDALQSV